MVKTINPFNGLTLVASAVGLCVLAGPAVAQQGYYDRFGNFVELAPPPMWREPPPVLRRLPPVYAAPVYREADPYAPPPGWVRLPPGEIPGAPSRRVYVDPEAPPDYGLQADPDALSEGYVDDGDGFAPPIGAYGEDGYRETPRDFERGHPLDRARGLRSEDPYFREARPDLAPPPGFGDALAPPADRSAGAIAALDRYAGAKAAAIDRSDVFARLEDIRSVNAYLVSLAAEPATSATIRAVDKLLGLDVTPETTALPGAGTEVSTPKSAGSGAEKARRLAADYARLRAQSLDSRDDADRRRLDGDAAALLAAAGVDLTTEERAGLDAFLGVGAGRAVVAGAGRGE